MKKRNTKRIIAFLEDIDWAFEVNNFKRHLRLIDSQPEESPDLTAEVVPDMVYREMTVKLYPRFWELSFGEQREALLHELVHVVLQETKLIALDFLDGKFHSQQEIKDKNEIAVSRITHLLDCLLLGKLTYARRAYKKYVGKSL